MKTEDVLTSVVTNTDSSLVMAIVVVAVVLIVIAIPFYKMAISYDREKRNSHTQREGQLIEVIQHNTSVISELKVLLVSNSSNQTEAKAEYHRRLDDIEDSLSKLHEVVLAHNNQIVEVMVLLKNVRCVGELKGKEHFE